MNIKLHKYDCIELSDTEKNQIDKIRELKSQIDFLCCELVNTLHNDNLDLEIVQDIMYESGIVEIAGKITVNKCIKETYKNLI
jgi:hypothetical protein